MKQVTIRGVTYPSIAVAAQMIGCHVNTIGHHLRKGTLDKAGMNERNRWQDQPHPQAKPVTIRGVTYKSRASAARALGVTPGVISQAVIFGNEDGVGLKKHERREAFDRFWFTTSTGRQWRAMPYGASA